VFFAASSQMGMDTLGKEKTLMFWLQTNLLFWKHYKTNKSNVLYTKGADLEIENELEIQKWSKVNERK
jgi:hypothetical protein